MTIHFLFNIIEKYNTIVVLLEGIKTYRFVDLFEIMMAKTLLIKNINITNLRLFHQKQR